MGEGVQQPSLSPCRVLKAGPLREMGPIQRPTLAAVSGQYPLDPGLSVVERVSGLFQACLGHQGQAGVCSSGCSPGSNGHPSVLPQGSSY